MMNVIIQVKENYLMPTSARSELMKRTNQQDGRITKTLFDRELRFTQERRSITRILSSPHVIHPWEIVDLFSSFPTYFESRHFEIGLGNYKKNSQGVQNGVSVVLAKAETKYVSRPRLRLKVYLTPDRAILTMILFEYEEAQKTKFVDFFIIFPKRLGSPYSEIICES